VLATQFDGLLKLLGTDADGWSRIQVRLFPAVASGRCTAAMPSRRLQAPGFQG